MRLSVRDLSAAGPHGEPLLRGVSFDIAAGETLALLGSSGSGKSLTGRAVLALPPIGVRYRGHVLLEGMDLLASPEPMLQSRRGVDVAMVFQEPATALNPVYRIGAQIAEPMRLHTRWDGGQRAARVIELLERTGLCAAGVGPERYPHELSGGQRQRVALAIAMALAPKVVVADEPTSALDSVSAARVLNLLAAMTAESGAALVLITHDLNVARRADRIAVMEAGRLVETAASETFLGGPKSQEGQRLVTRPAHIAPVVPGDTLLEVENLAAQVSGFALLRGISLRVRRGERVAVVGASGSGKTTFARALLGLLPASGAVRLNGEAVSLAERRRRIAMVFQDPAASFNPRHTMMWAVTEPIYRQSRIVRRRRAEAGLNAVGLSADMLARRPHAFSGGQRQRLAIARALVSEPDVLVADEAVSALDAALRAQVVSLLADIAAARGMGLIFIAHDLALVRRLAHRVLVMDAGAIVEEATPDTLYAAPQHAASLALVEAAAQAESASQLQRAGDPATSGVSDGA